MGFCGQGPIMMRTPTLLTFSEEAMLFNLSEDEVKILMEGLYEAARLWQRKLPATRGQAIIASPYEELMDNIGNQLWEQTHGSQLSN
jgi:hypothetical protein